MPIEEKTKQFLIYITKQFKSASITTLMKLAYLIDLVAVSKGKKQISNFIYRRYKYGPFDPNIYSYLMKLLKERIFEDCIEYVPAAEEYVVYTVNGDNPKINFDKLSLDEKKIIDEVAGNLVGYGAKAITEIAYKTKPMLSIGATLGGTENINVILDMKAK